jgi:HAMP domain-containing protein
MAGVTVRVDTGRSAALALSSSTLAFGSAALVIAATLVILRNVNSPAHNAWPAMLPLVPLAVLMVASHHWRRPWIMLLHLGVGAVSIGLYAFVVLENAPEAIATSPFILALPQLAFVATIAPSVLGIRSIVFVALAYGLGQGAVLVAGAVAGRFPDGDYLTASGALVILVIAVSNLALRRRAIRDRRALDRARREADAMAYQKEFEAQVVALFHDTVLSELTVLGNQQPGPLAAGQRAALERDLAMIAEGEWWPGERGGAASPGEASGAAGGDAGGADAPVHLPPLVHEAISTARSGGLRVDLLGEVSALHRLDGRAQAALGLALGQALVNAGRHAGTDRAEIVVDGAPDAVVVMVADPGRGFDPDAVPVDRLGVSQSILGRIRDAGGEARLFTSPGAGTAYLFTLPAAPAPAGGGAP